MKNLFDKIRVVFEKIELNLIGKWLFYGIIIGMVSAAGAYLFVFILNLSTDAFMHSLIGYYPPSAGAEDKAVPATRDISLLLMLLVPAFGGLISGLLVYFFAPEAEGHGTDAVIRAYHKEKGIIRKRIPLIKMLASSIVIGTGGSAGREGPIAQIGAGFGSFLGSILKVSVRDRRIMLIAGAAGGISCIFHAPLGAAIFGTEVLYRNHELETETLIPCIISSLVGYSIYTSIMGRGTLFSIPNLSFKDPRELLLYAMLGVFCAAIGILYVKFFYGSRNLFFRKLKIAPYLKPMTGGLMLGCLAIFLPQVLGGGYGHIQDAINGSMPLKIMFLLIFAKILATSFTISSGGSGGVFAPSLFIGAMLGGAFGKICSLLFHQTYVPGIACFVVVGMGGFFAGIAKVPIASLIMVSEMTGGYGLLVPMMLVSTISTLFARDYSLYEEQALSTLDSPAHKGEFSVDVLDGINVMQVKLAKQAHIIKNSMHLNEIISIVKKAKQNIFPVIDKDNKVKGIISLDDLSGIAEEDILNTIVVADDIAKTVFPFVLLHENLNSAIKKAAQFSSDEIPVLDEKSNFVGMLTKHAIIHTYYSKLLEMQEEKKKIKKGRFI